VRTIAVFASVACLAGGVAVTAAARTGADLRITPGKSIGKVKLGMTELQVRATMGRPRSIVRRRAGFGRSIVEYEYGFAEYVVRFFGPRDRLRVVRVGTTLRQERTREGLGVGSAERAVLRALPRARCERLRTRQYGVTRIVVSGQRNCTLFAASGRRTIFTSGLVRSGFGGFVEPAAWLRRARVLEVAVATGT
jgi:hypothetical protein